MRGRGRDRDGFDAEDLARKEEVVRPKRPSPGKVASTSLIGNLDPPGYSVSPGKRTLTMRLPQPRPNRSVQAGTAPTDEHAGEDGPARAPAGGTPFLGDFMPPADGFRSAGEPLPGEVRGTFERSLDTDLGGVRVHAGPEADAAAGSLGARAFAVGPDIAFRAGQYAPHTREGRWLLAHEVAHTAQQRGTQPVAQAKLESTRAGDAAETEADRAADAMVAGRPARVSAQPRAIARFPPMGPMGGGGAAETPEWKKMAGPAKDYVAKHGQAIIDGLHSQIASVPFATGLDGVTWAAGDAKAFAGQFALQFFMQRSDPWQFLVTTLAPDDVERLVDKGRDALAMPEAAQSYHPGVQIELGNAYKLKIRDSLARAVPRYVAVWNQHVLAEESKVGKRAKDAPPPAAPEPSVAQVRASTPIDPYVIRALGTQLKVDFVRYRELHPAERQAHAIKGVDKVTLEIQWRRSAINWVRATPPDATAEDVAAELYGSETFAYLITPAAPLFGFQTDTDSIGKLKPAYRGELQKIQSNNDYHGSHVPEHGPSGDPAGQLLGGPLGDEAAKNQAKGIPPTPNISKAGIVERLRAIVGEFDWLEQSVKPWGQGSLLDAARRRVDQRSRDLAKSTDPAAGADWDGQSRVQLEVVQTARNAVHVAARQDEAFKSFPGARSLIINLVRDYVEAAALSDLGATARTKLAAAEQKSRMFPADLMEMLLETFRPVIQSAKIVKTRAEGRAGNRDDSRYGAGAMEKKELELRQGLAKVRDLLMEHPEKAKPELDRLLKEVTALSTEVALVSNMDSCDAAWAALDSSLSKVGSAVSVVTSEHGNAPLERDMAAVATMRQQWKTIYDKWKTAKTQPEKKAVEDELSAKAKSPEWTELFERIRKDIKDHETLDKWVTFGVMVGIAIITGGIGAYVGAAAGAAWGAAAGFAASTVVEAAAFSALTQTLVQKDPSLASFFADVEKNLLMFGGLKAIGKVWGVSAKALGLTAGETAATGLMVQFTALNVTSLVEADLEKRKLTGGKGLTEDEIISISFHNLAFLAAVAIGQRIAKPFLADIQLKGQIQGELVAIRASDAKVESLARQVEAEKGANPGRAQQLNKSLASALAKREAVLARLGEQVKLYEAGQKSALNKAQYERIVEQIAEHAQQKADFQRQQILDLLEPAGPNRFEVGKDALKQVVDHFGPEAVLLGVDPVTSARTYEIRTKDSAPWRVVERVQARAGQTAGPPESAVPAKAAGKDATPSHRIEQAIAAGRAPAIADVVELRGALVQGSVKPENLPEAVRRAVFQGWKDVPESLRAIAEQTNFARAREGKAGVIRPESELSDADVAQSMNAQLGKIGAGQIDQMLGKFSPEQQAKARQVLARASGFGNMESMNSLREAVEPHLNGGPLYTPGSGSLADNLTYLASKQTFKSAPGRIPTTGTVKPGTIVILDQVVLARIKSDASFAQSLNQPGVVLLRPRGFTSGINMFDAKPKAIEQRVGQLLERALRIEKEGRAKTFDEAIVQALDEATDATLKEAKVTGTLQAVDPAARADLSSEGIAKQLNGNAGITAEQVRDVLSQIPEADRAMLRELLAQQSEVFSPRRLAEELAEQHGKIVAGAGVPRSNVYFLIPEGNKSYGMLAMAHREATGTPVDHYINGPAELASRKLGRNTVVVILDDVAGSGDSLADASGAATRSGYPGKIVVSPVVSTSAADQRFRGPGGVSGGNPNVAYDPGRVMAAIKDSPMFKGLSKQQQERLEVLLRNLGWEANGLSMAFPYMAPDNNNLFFADQFAKEFIVNKNADAAKKAGTWTPPPK